MTAAHSLPEGWRWVRFGDVVRQVKKTTKDPESDGLTRIVGLDHLDPESLPLNRWNELDELVDGTSFTHVFRAGQVLFGKRRAYQRKVAVPEFDGVCSGDILVFTPATPDLLPDYLPYVVQSDRFFELAVGTSAGSLSPRTKWQELAKYEFPLPPLDHQREVVEVLKQVRTETGALLRSLDAWQVLSMAVGAEQYREIGDEHWVPLGDICEIGPQNGATVAKDKRSGPTRMINMGALFGDEVKIPGSVADSDVAMRDKELQRFSLATGDLLFARRSIVLEGAGRSVLVSSVERPTVFESSILRVRVDRAAVHPEVVLRYLHSPVGRQAMRGIVRQGAVAGIAGSDLRRFRVPVPPRDFQERVVRQWEALDGLHTALKEHLECSHRMSSALRERLLQDCHV